MLRFRNQKMNVFGHNDVAEDKKDISPACLLQGALKEVTGGRVAEIRLTGVTTESEEMEVPGLLVTLELGRHESRQYSKTG